MIGINSLFAKIIASIPTTPRYPSSNNLAPMISPQCLHSCIIESEKAGGITDPM